MKDSFPIDTTRLRIRRMHPADVPAFAAYRADPELARYQGWRPMSQEDARRFVVEMQMSPAFIEEAWWQLAVARRPGDGLIGDIGLCLHAGGELEIGFTLRREAHGQGLATEALAGLVRAVFQRDDVRRVVGIVDARNAASIRVLERLGMRQVSSENTEFKGEMCTELRFELERPEATRP